jgi:hypothetical protein
MFSRSARGDTDVIKQKFPFKAFAITSHKKIVELTKLTPAG